ncbi:MAG: UV DNA damage repair endonuclease UvsE [Rhodothermia bacterium]|nr:UV DNA damage repair endonuclease UvsE [Rhodothermia bacterium]
MVRYLGFACMTVEPPRTTNHSFRLKNLTEEHARAYAERNVDDLEAILLWMLPYKRLRCFRVGSQLVPFASHERFVWDWAPWIGERLRTIGARFLPLGFRFSMHPGQYTVLNGPNEQIYARSLREVRYSIRVLELLGAQEREHGVVLHIGGVYGDKSESLRRLSQRLLELPEEERRRLALENDERLYTIADVVSLCEETGTLPIWDAHHHRLNPTTEPLSGLMARLYALWEGRAPEVHLSSQRPDGPPGAHAEGVLAEDLAWLLERLPAPADLMLEAKSKERAALQVAEWLDAWGAWAYEDHLLPNHSQSTSTSPNMAKP